jgi:RNA polymerase sigma-70 factor (ECF subfamily)
MIPWYGCGGEMSDFWLAVFLPVRDRRVGRRSEEAMASRKGAGPADRKRPSERDTSESPSTSPASAAEPDALLVERLKNGDRQASEELIRRYQEKAFAVAFRMLSGDREEALDLTQDAFLTALRKIDGFEGKSSFYTWFYRILINTCLDFLRRRKRWRRLLYFRRPNSKDAREPLETLAEVASSEPNANPGATVDARELQRDVRGAMALLSDRQRMIFNLKVFEEMRIAEIARTMGLAEGTVKSHLFRATRIMRGALADWAGR